MITFFIFMPKLNLAQIPAGKYTYGPYDLRKNYPRSR